MIFSSQIRTALLLLIAGLATWALKFLAPEQVEQLKQSLQGLVEPITALLVVVIGLGLSKLEARYPFLKFLSNGEEKQSGGTNRSGGNGSSAAMLVMCCTALGFGGVSLVSCSPVQIAALKAIPIRASVETPHSKASYSSKSGLEVTAKVDPAK